MTLNKDQLLHDITSATENNLVTRREVIDAYEKGRKKRGHDHTRNLRTLNLTEIFSSLGCGIIFLGIAILISEHWIGLSSFNKIVLTLGSGIAAYVIGFLFSLDRRVWIISSSFYFLSALLIPFGIAVILQLNGFSYYSAKFSTIVSGISLLVFGLSFIFFRKELFLFFSIIYATWFFFGFMNLINPNSSTDFVIYCAIVVSICYIFLGYYFDKNNRYNLTRFLYIFGSLMLLGSFFSLALLHRGSFYEWGFPFLLFLVIYLSVRFRSVAFLTFSVIFLILWIMDITERYFSESFGWPISLVVAGFLLIIIAYAYLQIKKKYFK